MHTRFLRTSASALALAILFGDGASAATPSALVEAIKRDDSKAVEAALRAGAGANSADDTGATALMYAALYAGPGVVRQLLERGADPNHANRFGSTALMWAVPRVDNVRALLAARANVNAQASNGWTPLTVAVRFGNAAAVKLLLAGGADISASANRRPALTGALFSPDPSVRRLLRDAGLVPASAADLSGPVLNQARDDVETLRHLLSLGIDPREELQSNTIRIPTFFLAARDGQLDAMRAFVDKGMNAAHVGARRTTALMLAAGADRPNMAALQFLIDQGADVHAIDDSGRTALDWALMRGETEVSAFIRRAGGRSSAIATPTPPAVTRPRPAREAIALAIGQLQPAGRAFTDRTKCSSCHNENLPGIAVARARDRGINVNEALDTHSWSVTATNYQNRRELILLGDAVAQTGLPPSAGYGLLEMVEAKRPSSPGTEAVAIGLARRQLPDGSWDGGESIRPPLNGSNVVKTALAIRGISTFAPAGLRNEVNARVRRGREFLEKTAPLDTQEQAFKLLGLVWAGASRTLVARERAALVALQRKDGGWGQMPTLPSDAYATGQALYALHAAGVAATADPYRRGADYLLRTQLVDGTWFVPTRAFGVQPYFETGFPHGGSQFISATATAWAAIALSYGL
jgi:ankyrin repeat protein